MIAEQSIDRYLPISWLQQHSLDIQWGIGTTTWRSGYYKKHCLPMPNRDATKGFAQTTQEGKERTSSYCWSDSTGKVWHNKGDVAGGHYRE